MSLVITTTPKDCSKKGFHFPKLNKKLIYTLCTLFFSLLSFIFLLWLILHPSKPEFYLQDTAVYQLSLASPRLLNSTIQTTIVSKNPNTRVGIYYDNLRAYAVFKGQQITEDSLLPPFYQGHEDSNLLSTSLSGTAMPVASSFGYEVSHDQSSGVLYLKLKLDGKLRWKVWSWSSQKYRFVVDCTAAVVIKPGDVLGPTNLVHGSQCSTNL